MIAGDKIGANKSDVQIGKLQVGQEVWRTVQIRAGGGKGGCK